MKKFELRQNKFKGIMIKLVMLYLALVFIVMIVCGTFIYMRIKNQEADKVKTDLERIATQIEDEIFKKAQTQVDLDFITREVYNNKLSPIANRIDIECTILDENGNTIAPEAGKYYQDSVIVSAILGNDSFEPWVRGTGQAFSDDSRVRIWLNYATPATDADGNKYIIFLSMNGEELLESLNAVMNTIIIAVALAMVLAVVLGVLFSSTLTEPITSLTRIAGEMTEGNLNQQIPVKGDDEIGQLTQSFNNMAKSLDKTLSDMTSEKNRIEIILNNMTDGVLAYDIHNTLIHANYASSEMLCIDDIEKTEFNDIMNILGITAENADDFAGGKSAESVVEINGKYISVNYNNYYNLQGAIDGVVIVLQDVTKHTKLDNMRREFVANVSHEIRTPLSTVKAYAETLLEGALEDKGLAKTFLETINSEADRMTLLTTDLLELSRFDNKQLSMETEEVNLIALINNSIRQNTVLAQSKNQKIVFQPEQNNIVILCDPSRINQVFNNVLSNSIKYSGEGSTISIVVNAAGRFYKVYIKDEGVGIPKEDLKRIFERFYRVDKARSRSMGGTGLGLAIAKEIMDAHEGTISAISGVGKGTTMVLCFKKPSS